MPTAESKALLHRFFDEVVNQQDFAVLDAIISPTFCVVPGDPAIQRCRALKACSGSWRGSSPSSRTSITPWRTCSRKRTGWLRGPEPEAHTRASTWGIQRQVNRWSMRRFSSFASWRDVSRSGGSRLDRLTILQQIGVFSVE